MLDWMFDPQCAACGAATRDPLCPPCASSLEPAPQPLALANLASAWVFGGQLASAIRRLKFTGASHVARALAPLWTPVLVAAASDAIVVPVPLHWRRRMARGYDHAWLLAVHACAYADRAPPRALLRRVRAAAPQSTLSAPQRAQNLAGAFRVRGDVRGREVVLVDDVATTGATLAACSAPLYAAGASHVSAVTVAVTAAP